LNNKPLQAGIITLLVWAIVITAGCSDGDRSVTTSQGVAKAFDFSQEDGWVVLTRPNSEWVLGTIIEINADRSPRDIGTIADLGCVPSDYWVVESNKAPASAYTRELNYDLSLSATLGVADTDLVKAGLSIAGDGTGSEPNYKTAFKVGEATEQRVRPIKLAAWLEANVQDISDDCQRLLLDTNRYLIDKVYQIDHGALEVAARTGAQIDLTLPRFQAIADAAANTGFQVDKTGKLTITGPITFAVHTADFSALRKRLEPQKQVQDQPGFAEVMQTAGASLPY